MVVVYDRISSSESECDREVGEGGGEGGDNERRTLGQSSRKQWEFVA
jgi:hypothetical protein